MLSRAPLVPAPSRGALTLAYGLFCAAGVASLLWPVARPVEHAARPWQALAWTIFFIAGGAICALGTVTDRWLGELVGLPLLMTVFAFFAVAAIATPTRDRLSTVSGVSFLVAVALLLHVRWRQVWGIRRLAAQQNPPAGAG